MARDSFRPTPGDRTRLQVIETADYPDEVTIDLDDKDPNNFQVVEADDRSDAEKEGTTRDPAEWGGKNAEDPKGVTPRVQKRFDRLKAETETERRLRLQTERERDEAVQAAQRQQAEINDLRRRLSTNTDSLSESMQGERKARVADATRRLEQAHAEGNSAEIAKATADMTAAQAELATIVATAPPKRTPEQQQEQQRQVQQPAPQQQRQTQAPNLAPNVVSWISANPWFNKDTAKTQFAVSIHNALEARGIKPTDDAYIKELDKGMKAVYADHQPYSGSSQDEDEGGERTTAPRRTNAVGPGSRESGNDGQQNPRTVVLTSSELAIARQLNLTPQQYAASKVKYNANRKGA